MLLLHMLTAVRALRAISLTHQNEVAFKRLRTLNAGGTGRLD